jgi:preprotein translocase subunit SecA
VLSVLDRKWREHLYEMDYLREGIGLRAMAQRDPLVEYQREGFDMFNSMMDGIKEESVGNLFNLQFEVQENPIVEEAPGAAPAAASAAPAAAVQSAEPVPPPAEFGAPAGQAVAGRGGQGAGAQGGRHAARSGGQQSGTAQNGPGQNGPAQNGPGQNGPGQGGSRQSGGGARQGGGARRGGGRHAAADGRGHATAAGRGQAATQSGGGAHAAAADGATPQGAVPTGLEPRRPRQLQYSAPSEGGGVEHRADSTANPFANVGRNDLCPCGSGRKYKRCHGGPRNT